MWGIVRIANPQERGLFYCLSLVLQVLLWALLRNGNDRRFVLLLSVCRRPSLKRVTIRGCLPFGGWVVGGINQSILQVATTKVRLEVLLGFFPGELPCYAIWLRQVVNSKELDLFSLVSLNLFRLGFDCFCPLILYVPALSDVVIYCIC